MAFLLPQLLLHANHTPGMEQLTQQAERINTLTQVDQDVTQQTLYI